jgi:hypothetical protein
MYEAVPPKRQVPYAWIVGGLTVLCVCLAIVTVSNGAIATKNAEALAAAQTAAVAQEKRLAEANSRIHELTAELARLRKVTAAAPKEPIKQVVVPALSPQELTARKAALLADALLARDRGNLAATKANYEAVLAIDPRDMGAREGLNAVVADIAEAIAAKAAADAAEAAAKKISGR